MKKIFHSFFDVHLCPPPTLRKVPPPLFGVQSHGELKIKTCQLPPFLQPHRKRQESTPCYTGVLASSYQTPCTIHLVCGFFFVVWASSFHPLLGRTIDLEAAVEQPFDCLIVRNRQAVQSMGRSMDWTLEDNMVEGLLFCATLTGRRGSHTLFVLTRTEKSDTGADAVKSKPRCCRKDNSRRVGAGVGDESSESRSVAQPCSDSIRRRNSTLQI